MSGTYVIFEGADGVGKSTIMKAVADNLVKLCPQRPVLQTSHPGSTPLGKHLRKLVKTPLVISPDITIDDLSRQLLYMVDTVSFIKSLLIPALDVGKTVLADRSSFISAMVYGLADGLTYDEISKLFDVITPPRADRCYILTCPVEISRQRILKDRDTEPDHYDSKPEEFSRKINQIYTDLLRGPAVQISLLSRSVAIDNIKFIDTTIPFGQLVEEITTDLLSIYNSSPPVE